MKRLTTILLLVAACGGTAADPADACQAYAQGNQEQQELNDWYSDMIDLAPEGDVKDAFYGVFNFVADGDFDSPGADRAWDRLAQACATVGVTITE